VPEELARFIFSNQDFLAFRCSRNGVSDSNIKAKHEKQSGSKN
jgi:hypothetical protein